MARWKKILLVSLVLLVLSIIIGIPYLLAVMITRAGTRPMDRALTSTPRDDGIDYEDVEFEATDGVRISAWYLGGGDKNVSVAVGHGLFRSRREVLDRAVFFRKLGFDTLVFDFRRHGASGGERSTLGYQERLDFEGAVRFLVERAPSNRVLLYGVSMGAAAAVLAARDTPDVDAVIADSPFSSIEHTVVHHLHLLFGLPRFPLGTMLLYFLELRGGFDRRDFDLDAAMARLGDRPVLVIAGEKDRRMPPDVQRRLAAESTCPETEFHLVPGAGHGAAYRTAPEAYEQILRGFLRRAKLLT